MAKKRPEEMSAEEIVAAQREKVGAPEMAPPTDDQIMELAGEVVKDEAEQPPTPPTPPAGTPDPWAVLAQIAAAMQALAANAQNQQSGQAIEVLTAAVTRLAEASIEGSKLQADATMKSRRPSNEVVPEISVFNRRGRDPQLEDGQDEKMHRATVKPPLKCEMFFPWILEWESLTREEVQLCNLLEEGSYVVKRADRSKIVLTVQIQYAVDNKTPSRLMVNNDTAFNQENYRNMPPMPDMLRDMLKQHDRSIAQRAAMVLTDEEEEALIESGALSVTR